ncbi:MAG TPA: response regulator transcription factor [Candidatus Limnocylindrales bacterium]|nr:response regulator transcription factor [Candidatus Limnocylindrales bacterium]
MADLDLIRVLVVDDHPLFRAGVCQRLGELDSRLVVVGEAWTSRQAQDMVARLAPDVVLMDIALPGENGIEATRALKRTAPRTAVILLSVYDDEPYIEAAVEAGAAGYLLKTVQGRELAAAVRSAHEGDAVLSPDVARKVFRRLLRRPASSSRSASWQRLSGRETEVLGLVAGGSSNREIASRLKLSERTVHTHMRNIFAKLQVGSRTEAVVLGVKDGFLRANTEALADGP